MRLQQVLYVIALALNLTGATQNCDAAIENFIQCLNGKLVDKVSVLKSELSQTTQQKLTNCFVRFTCDAPVFAQARVEYFVQDVTWQARLIHLLSFVENVDPKVTKCMIDYFVSMMLDSLGKCVRDVGPDRIKDFYFPPMNIQIDFKFQDLKQIILNRMMVRSKLKDCVQMDETRTKEMIVCLRSAKTIDAGDELCNARRTCRANLNDDTYCANRLDDVLKATCTCFNRTVKKVKSLSRGTPLRLIRDGIVGGGIEQQFRQCHAQAGLPFPHQKLEAVKQVFKDTVVDMILHKQIPDALKNAMRLLLDVFKDFGSEWSGILCSDCSSGYSQLLNLDTEVYRLRQIARETFT